VFERDRRRAESMQCDLTPQASPILSALIRLKISGDSLGEFAL
jgi:hypothetical protein